MMQGDAYNIPIEIMVDDGIADKTLFDEVEIVIGTMVKTMSSGAITYDTENKVFLFPISQKESMKLGAKAEAQVRVKPNNTDNVFGVELGEIDVAKTLSKAVL